MTVTNEGLRIELPNPQPELFFDSGSPKISGDGSELLTRAGPGSRQAAEQTGA